jgi:acetamidase/formamidase
LCRRDTDHLLQFANTDIVSDSEANNMTSLDSRYPIAAALVLSVFLCGLDPDAELGAQQLHELPLAPENVHWGYYSGSLEPVLRVDSGDSVRVETLLARGLERLLLAGADPDQIPQRLKDVDAAITDRGPGAHPLTGPMWVEGAEPGDVVEVRMLDFELLHPFGLSYFVPGSGTLPEDFPYTYLRVTEVDVERSTAQFAPDITIPLAPFFGSIGVAPLPLMGRISSNPPGHHAGNIDNKELVAGTSLYLPVHVPGALVSFGDAHGIQGDGEVALTALEISVSGLVQIVLHKDRSLARPRAETPTHFITMGFHPDLDEAAKMATREMITFLVEEKGLTRDDAYILVSLAVDLAVTQLVDGTRGVHAKLPKAIFR